MFCFVLRLSRFGCDTAFYGSVALRRAVLYRVVLSAQHKCHSFVLSSKKLMGASLTRCRFDRHTGLYEFRDFMQSRATRRRKKDVRRITDSISFVDKRLYACARAHSKGLTKASTEWRPTIDAIKWMQLSFCSTVPAIRKFKMTRRRLCEIKPNTELLCLWTHGSISVHIASRNR